MDALGFLTLLLLAMVGVAVGFAVVLSALALLFRVGVEEVSVGWFPVFSFRSFGFRTRMGLLPLGSSVKLAPPLSAPPVLALDAQVDLRGAEALEHPDDRPEHPAWVQLLLLTATAAVQLAACVAFVGPQAIDSFGRGLWQFLWPVSEQLGPWVHHLSERAAAGISAGLVAVVAVKVLSVNAVLQLASLAAKVLAPCFRMRPATAPGPVMLAYLVLSVVWLWRIGVVLWGR